MHAGLLPSLHGESCLARVGEALLIQVGWFLLYASSRGSDNDNAFFLLDKADTLAARF